jgi:hypothetical protein
MVALLKYDRCWIVIRLKYDGGCKWSGWNKPIRDEGDQGVWAGCWRWRDRTKEGGGGRSISRYNPVSVCVVTGLLEWICGCGREQIMTVRMRNAHYSILYTPVGYPFCPPGTIHELQRQAGYARRPGPGLSSQARCSREYLQQQHTQDAQQLTLHHPLLVRHP